MKAIITLNEQLKTWSPTEPGSTEPGWRAKPLDFRQVLLWRRSASSSGHSSLVGRELRTRPALPPGTGISGREKKGPLTMQPGCALWVQILLNIPCISLFCPWSLAQGDLLFLIGILIKSLLSPCYVQGIAKTCLFLVIQEIKSKMETTFLSFPHTWCAGMCVFYIGGIPWKGNLPSPRGSASILFTVPQHGPRDGRGEGKEPGAGQ